MSVSGRTLSISFISAWGFAAWEEYQQRPKVIFDSGRVKHKQVGHLSPKVEKIEGKMVLSIYDEDQDKIQPLVWNGKEVKFAPAEGKLVYQEFIECHGLKGLLSLTRDEAGKEYLYLNIEPPKVYSMNGS